MPQSTYLVCLKVSVDVDIQISGSSYNPVLYIKSGKVYHLNLRNLYNVMYAARKISDQSHSSPVPQSSPPNRDGHIFTLSTTARKVCIHKGVQAWTLSSVQAVSKLGMDSL